MADLYNTFFKGFGALWGY